MTETLLIEKISSMKNEPASVDGKLARYILQHPYDTIAMSAEMISEKSGVSYASICRFVRKLTYSGIISFKKALSSELHNIELMQSAPTESTIPNTDIPAQIPIEQIKDSIFGVAGSILKSCASLLDVKLLNRAVEALNCAGSIYIAGLGTSSVTALYAYTKLFRLDLPCSCDTDIIIMKMKASMLKSGDVLLAVSSSGRTKMILELSHIAAKSGAKVISICDFAGSPLSRCSDIGLVTTARDAASCAGVDLPLIQGQVTIIDLIYACLYNNKRQDAIKQIEITKTAVKRDKV